MDRAKKHKKRHVLLTILTVALILIALFFLLCYLTPTEEEYSRKWLTNEIVISKIEGLEIPNDPFGGEIIHHTGYTLSYNEEYEVPSWIAYELTEEELSPAVERNDSFKSDPMVSTGSAELSDYRGSGYDRGHMAPAADFRWSSSAMDDTFYLSNMTPQNPSFNRGIWADLENAVRNMAMDNSSVYVVTGPVLTDGPYDTIGESQVAVPKNFYKVVLDYTLPEIKAIGFVLPNEGSDDELSSFAMTIDEVEEITDIDFFPLLDDRVESDVESRIELYKWPLGALTELDYSEVKDTSYVYVESQSEKAEKRLSDYFYTFKNFIFEKTHTKEWARRMGLI